MKYLVKQITNENGQLVKRHSDFYITDNKLELGTQMVLNHFKDKKKNGTYVILERIDLEGDNDEG